MAERTSDPEAELRRLRKRIDAVDRRIVGLIDERAQLALEVGRVKRTLGRRGIRDDDREREVLLRVAMAKKGPVPQADLLALYRRLMATMRKVETADRRIVRRPPAARAVTGETQGTAPETPEASETARQTREPAPETAD